MTGSRHLTGETMFENDLLRISLAALSLAASVIYLAFVSGPASPMRAGLKTFTIGVLALLPLTYASVPGAHVMGLAILSLALALSALGDLLLALKNQERFFVLGLASFLLAHVAYVAAFVPYTDVPDGGALVAIIGVVAGAGLFLRVLIPRLGKVTVPVLCYFTVIMAMVAAALTVREASWILGAGVVLFALSDSLIAVRKFLQPFARINEAVWVTYCAAQFMITAALLMLMVPAQLV